jgi:hypothetical protein
MINPIEPSLRMDQMKWENVRRQLLLTAAAAVALTLAFVH